MNSPFSPLTNRKSVLNSNSIGPQRGSRSTSATYLHPSPLASILSQDGGGGTLPQVNTSVCSLSRSRGRIDSLDSTSSNGVNCSESLSDKTNVVDGSTNLCNQSHAVNRDSALASGSVVVFYNKTNDGVAT